MTRIRRSLASVLSIQVPIGAKLTAIQLEAPTSRCFRRPSASVNSRILALNRTYHRNCLPDSDSYLLVRYWDLLITQSCCTGCKLFSLY
ncbi:hypothetical protein B0H10DRAFT_1204791 [Mycena sp. CBHHK59/15]|nr:hypothetical protein B0H10DRAFT_1204791 [Mycena sp. CBHHK59/15]